MTRGLIVGFQFITHFIVQHSFGGRETRELHDQKAQLKTGKIPKISVNIVSRVDSREACVCWVSECGAGVKEGTIGIVASQERCGSVS